MRHRIVHGTVHGQSIREAVARRLLAAKTGAHPIHLIPERAVHHGVVTETGIDAPLNALSARAKTLKDLSACGFRKHDIGAPGDEEQRPANRLGAGTVASEEMLDQLVVRPARLKHFTGRE